MHVPCVNMYCVQYVSVHCVWHLYINAPCVSTCERMPAFVGFACMCMHAFYSCVARLCMQEYARGLCSIAALFTTQSGTQWQLSWAMVECVFTAQWVLTGVSERAAVLSAQSAYSKEPSDMSVTAYTAQKACFWLSSLEPPTPPSGQLNFKPVSCGLRIAWASTVLL